MGTAHALCTPRMRFSHHACGVGYLHPKSSRIYIIIAVRHLVPGGRGDMPQPPPPPCRDTPCGVISDVPRTRDLRKSTQRPEKRRFRRANRDGECFNRLVSHQRAGDPPSGGGRAGVGVILPLKEDRRRVRIFIDLRKLAKCGGNADSHSWIAPVTSWAPQPPGWQGEAECVDRR